MSVFSYKRTGRPRNRDLEARVLSMLADGHPVGEIASACSIHRNTVTNIKYRLHYDDRSPWQTIGCADDAVIKARRYEEQSRLAAEEAKAAALAASIAAKRAMEATRYRKFLERVVVVIEHAEELVRMGARRRGRMIFSLDCAGAGEQSIHEKIGDSRATPFDETVIAETQSLINAALAKLSHLQRAVIKLGFYDQQSPEEISGIMDISVAEVVGSQNQAMGMLREMVPPSASWNIHKRSEF